MHQKCTSILKHFDFLCFNVGIKIERNFPFITLQLNKLGLGVFKDMKDSLKEGGGGK